MHEMALCLSVIGIVEEEARRQAFSKVRTVRLEIGALSQVEPQALRFSFAAVSRATLAEGARLDILEVPGTAWCLSCAKTVPIAQRYDACPVCGSYPLQVTGGGDMRVKELEVD